MINEIVLFREIDISHNDPLVLDHLQFQGDHLKITTLGIALVMDISIPIELNYVQVTPNFIMNEETIDVVTFILSEKILIVLFLDPTLEIDSALERCDSCYRPPSRHRSWSASASRKFVKIIQPSPPKVMTTILTEFQSQKTNLKLTCIPIK